MSFGSFKSPEDDWDEEIHLNNVVCRQEFNGYLISDELLSLLIKNTATSYQWAQFARSFCYAEDIDCPFTGDVKATLFGNAHEAGEIVWECPVCNKENCEDPKDFGY